MAVLDVIEVGRYMIRSVYWGCGCCYRKGAARAKRIEKNSNLARVQYPKFDMSRSPPDLKFVEPTSTQRKGYGQPSKVINFPKMLALYNSPLFLISKPRTSI